MSKGVRRSWQKLLLIFLVALANGVLLLIVSMSLASLPAPPPAPTTAPRPTALAASPATPTPLPTSPPSPVPILVPSPSPLPLPDQLTPGELPPDTATIIYVPELTGIPLTVRGLQASCFRASDSLGLLGAINQGPTVASYRIELAPFRGDGRYHTGADGGEIGGSVSITGLVQMFIGPPFDAAALVARDGALGYLRFSGRGVDGRRGEGLIRWECTETKPLPQ